MRKRIRVIFLLTQAVLSISATAAINATNSRRSPQLAKATNETPVQELSSYFWSEENFTGSLAN